MKTIVLSDVKANEFVGYSVVKCDIRAEINEHAIANIALASPNNISIDSVNEVLDGMRITLLEKNNANVLFSGKIKNAEIKDNGNSYEIQIVALSNSISLDEKRKRRSFQDVSMTYVELIEEVVCSEANTVVTCCKECDNTLDRIYIQYDETDWEFISRIASSIGLCISVDEQKTNTVIHIGMSDLKAEAEFDSVYYTCGISQMYYEHGGAEGLCYKPDYLYYDVMSYGSYTLGAEVEFKGEQFKICGKKICTDGELLVFLYRLGRCGLFTVSQIFNEKLAGIAFEGKVISTEKETLKIHLDMDRTQEKEKAYSFEWTPLSGNMMYCMPIIGTKVALYLADRDETSAKAIVCVGEGQESISGGRGPSYRAFTTEHNKQMELTENMVRFSAIDGEDKRYEVKLQDEEGITFDSAYGIYCIAGEEVVIDGKEIFIQAQTGMQLIQTGGVVSEDSLQNPVADIDMHEIIDMFTNTTVEVESEEEETLLEAFKDEPTEGYFDMAQFIGNIAVGVGVVLLAAVAVATTAVSCGAAAPFWAIFAAGAIGGGVAVGCMAYSDYQSGNVSDTGRYVIKALTSTVSGALAVICGPASYTGKFWTYVGKCALTGAWTSGLGNYSEQFLESLVYGDEFDGAEFLLSIGIGGLASGIAGGFSFMLTNYSSALKGLANLSDNKLKRWIWALSGKGAGKYVAYLQKLKLRVYKDATPFSSEEAALEWVRAHARTLISELNGNYGKKLTTQTALIESSSGGGLSTWLADKWEKITEDTSNSLDITQEYIVQYGY